MSYVQYVKDITTCGTVGISFRTVSPTDEKSQNGSSCVFAVCQKDIQENHVREVTSADRMGA